MSADTYAEFLSTVEQSAQGRVAGVCTPAGVVGDMADLGDCTDLSCRVMIQCWSLGRSHQRDDLDGMFRTSAGGTRMVRYHMDGFRLAHCMVLPEVYQSEYPSTYPPISD